MNSFTDAPFLPRCGPDADLLLRCRFDDVTMEAGARPAKVRALDAVALPSQPEMPIKAARRACSVSMAVVDRIVEASDRAVQWASNRNGRRRPDTLAVLMTLTIDGDGQGQRRRGPPESATAGAKAPAEAACLAKLAKKLQFPCHRHGVPRALPVHDRLPHQSRAVVLEVLRGRATTISLTSTSAGCAMA